MGKPQPSLARAKALRIGYGRRSGRLAGHEFLGMVPPILQKLLGAEEQGGADRRLIEAADVGPAGRLRFQRPEKLQGQVHLWETPIDPRDVVLHEEEETGERAALQETRLGLLEGGDGHPDQPLRIV